MLGGFGKLTHNLFIDSLFSPEIGFFSRIGECFCRLLFKGRSRGSVFLKTF